MTSSTYSCQGIRLSTTQYPEVRWSYAYDFSWFKQKPNTIIQFVIVYPRVFPYIRVFGPFRSENGYTLCPFWSRIGYGSRGMVFEEGTGVCERV